MGLGLGGAQRLAHRSQAIPKLRAFSEANGMSTKAVASKLSHGKRMYCRTFNKLAKPALKQPETA